MDCDVTRSLDLPHIFNTFFWGLGGIFGSYHRNVLWIAAVFNIILISQLVFLNSQSELASTVKFVMLNSLDPFDNCGIFKSPIPLPEI